MRHYSFWKTIPLSFYSKSLYRDVAQHWRGLGFTYLLFLISLIALPITAFFVFLASQVTLEEPYDFAYLIGQIPEVIIRDGAIYSDVPQPHFIRDKESGNVLAILDSTGSITDLKDFDYAIFLFTKHAVLIRKDSNYNRYETHQISPEVDERITQEQVRNIAEKIASYAWVAPLIFMPFMVLIYFVYRILQALLYALLGWIFSELTNAKLEYPVIVRLTSVTLTPVILLSVIADVIGLELPIFLFFMFAMGYLVFAIRASVENKANAAPQ